MTGEEVVDCILSVDETLSEVEEALEHKNPALALQKLREAREAINDLREDTEAEDDRQEVEMDVMRKLK
jgi:hypothetical protein